VQGIRKKNTTGFRERFRKIDLLLLDDIQFISKWQVTQDELFHTFNTLYLEGKQIVFASDRPPHEIQNIADRLRTRFEGGMVVDIQPPDLETRLAILYKLNDASPIKLDPDVLEVIALFVNDNVRTLIGAYKYLTSNARLSGQKITKVQAEVLLGVVFGKGKKDITPERVIEEVAKVFHVSKEDILSRRRMNFLVLPRQVAMYLVKQIVGLSLTETAKAFKRKDHTTVLHAVRKIEKLLEKDKDLHRRVVLIKSRLG